MCFPIATIFAVIIWCIIVGAVVAILRATIAFAGPKWGWGADLVAFLVQIFMIILWAVILIAIVTIVGDAVMCLIGMAPSLNLHGR